MKFKQKRDVIVRLMAAMLATSMLAGCGSGKQEAVTNSGEKEEAVSSAEQEKVTISLGCFGSNWEDKLYTDVYIPEFEKQNPNIKIEFIHIDDFVTKYATMASSGTLPDVSRQVTGVLPNFLSKDMYEPLDSYVQKDNFDISDFSEAAVKACTWDGKLLGIPQDVNAAGLFYDPEAFKAAGLKEPDDNYTLEQLYADAKALTVTKDGKVERYGLVQGYSGWTFIPFMLAEGGNLWTEDQEKSALDQPGAIKALEYWKKLMDEGVAPYPADMGTTGPEVYFQTKKAAMYIDGTWMSPTIVKNVPDFKFKATSFPKGKIKTTRSQSAVFCISRQSEQKEACWKLIKYLTSKEALTVYWQKSWVAPGARISIMNTEDFRNVPGQPEFDIPGIKSEQDFADMENWVITTFNNGWDNQSWIGKHQQYWEDITNKAIASVLVKDAAITPEEAFKKAAADINKLIEQGE